MGENLASSPVNVYYGKTGDIADRVIAALRDMGKDVDNLTVADLAPFDQFHSGGIDATRGLASLAGIARGSTVIDLGGGLGGPARVLAQEFGARVTVVDITETFVRGGAVLTDRLGLVDRVQFRLGDALAVPFPDESFDFVWSQHSTMNIADKEGLFAEIRRVLRPGGKYVFHEIMAGPGGPVQFPVPWAAEPAISHLRTLDEIRNLLTEGIGLTEVAWQDVSADARAWFAASRERMATMDPAPPGLDVVLGAELPARIASLGRNLTEDRVRIIRAVVEKPTGS